jgi:hypothetical protein
VASLEAKLNNFEKENEEKQDILNKYKFLDQDSKSFLSESVIEEKRPFSPAPAPAQQHSSNAPSHIPNANMKSLENKVEMLQKENKAIINREQKLVNLYQENELKFSSFEALMKTLEGEITHVNNKYQNMTNIPNSNSNVNTLNFNYENVMNKVNELETQMKEKIIKLFSLESNVTSIQNKLERDTLLYHTNNTKINERIDVLQTFLDQLQKVT